MARSNKPSETADETPEDPVGDSSGGTMTVAAIEVVAGDGPQDVVEDKAHDAEVETGIKPDATEPYLAAVDFEAAAAAMDAEDQAANARATGVKVITYCRPEGRQPLALGTVLTGNAPTDDRTMAALAQCMLHAVRYGQDTDPEVQQQIATMLAESPVDETVPLDHAAPIVELIEACHELYRAAEHVLPMHQLARAWNAIVGAKAARE